MNSPQFPQADPAIQYIAERVSHIEGASNCTAGYYQSHQKLLRRLNKTDEELARIRQILTQIDDREVKALFKAGLQDVISEMGQSVSDMRMCFDDISTEVSKSSSEIQKAAHEIRRDEELLSKDLKSDFETLQKKQANLQKRFDALLERSVTTNYVPTWQTGVTLVLAFGLGAMVGVYLI
jgi:chromosome segregation ATPase